MPAVVLDADVLSAGALRRDSPARQLLIVLYYGTQTKYLDDGRDEELRGLERAGAALGATNIGRGEQMRAKLEQRQQAVGQTLGPDAPSDYWLVSTEELQDQARQLVFDHVRGAPESWEAIDHAAWHRWLAASQDVIGAKELPLSARILGRLARLSGIPRAVLHAAGYWRNSHVVLRNRRGFALPGANALLTRAGIPPDQITSLDALLAKPPWATSNPGFDLRSVDPDVDEAL